MTSMCNSLNSGHPALWVGRGSEIDNYGWTYTKSQSFMSFLAFDTSDSASMSVYDCLDRLTTQMESGGCQVNT